MNSMTSRDTNRCHKVVGNVYNALCCDLISSNRTVVLKSLFFVPQASTDSSVRAWQSAAVMNEVSGHIPG